MPSCVFRKCTNYDSKVNKLQGISYHMFPTDQVKLRDWIAIVRVQRSELDWIPSKSSRICSNHFKASYKYVSKKGRTLLNKNAVPFIENPPRSLDKVSLAELKEIEVAPFKSQGNRPKRLSVLCKYVIKKYKLSESKKKIEEPASITTIGGKTLRDRQKIAAETASSTASTSKPPPKKRKVNKCQDDVELIRKGKQKDVPSKRLPKNDVDTEKKSRSREEFFPEIPVTTEFPIRIKEEPEPATHVNQDPLGPDDEDYTVIVKEEFEADEETRLVSQHTATSHTSEMKVKVPTLVRSQNVAPSSSGPPLMTVVADDIQLFANNVAEQLRTFPLNRALLLQLEIQTMIDNERQLLLH